VDKRAVELVFSRNRPGFRGGQIGGRLIDGNGKLYEDSAKVVLLPARKTGELSRNDVKTATVESGGAFRMTGIRPGDYRLLAWHKLNGYAYLNENFMKDFERRGTLVKIERNSRVAADAPLMDAP
jgi:hypothetical protein